MIESGILAFAGVVVAAVLGAFGVMLGHQSKRLTDVETKMTRATRYNTRLWLYCRNLIDLYYRYRRDGSPDPPKLPGEDDDPDE